VTAGVEGGNVVGDVAKAGQEASAHDGHVHQTEPTGEVMSFAFGGTTPLSGAFV
jgi:hypothetical protein